VTLIASAYDLAPGTLWFPLLIETLIATSIVYMALENIVSPALTRRWLITFAFGLVHGFGFSFALRESLQFAGSYPRSICCSGSSWLSGWARSSCRPWWPTPRGTG